MEYVIDLPCLRKAELICDWGKDFDYHEGSFMFWGEFGVDDRAFEVSGLQPDFVALGEESESPVATRGHDLVGEFMGNKGFILGGNQRFKAGFHYRDRRVGD